MTLHLEILRRDGQPLPPGSAVRIEVRDTSLADAASVVVARMELIVPQSGTTSSLPVSIDVDHVPDGATVWVHLSDRPSARVNRGDFLTTESYPVTNAGDQRLTVRLSRVG